MCRGWGQGEEEEVQRSGFLSRYFVNSEPGEESLFVDRKDAHETAVKAREC